MADFWKSQTRKYCDFCKCWISDNKASVDFHEGGKKHKENVSKRLKEIHKNSAKQAKQQRKFENDLEKMEKAAMEAYMKDVANGNRDMIADSIIQQKWSKEQAAPEPANPNQIPEASPNAHPRCTETVSYKSYGPADIDPLDPFAKQKLARLEAKEKIKTKTEARKEKKKKKKESANLQEKAGGSQLLQRKVWYEAQSQGYSYYWNIETNETMWEPPADGFMSLAEQAEEAKEQALQEELFEQIDKEDEQEKAIVLEEQRANAEREKLKEIRKRFHESKNPDTENDDKSDQETVSYRRDYSVPEKPQPYGSWQVVNKPRIDFQLPEKEKVPVATSVLRTEEPLPRKVFKEKTITSISTGDSDDEAFAISFRKRKFSSKNVRKRMDND
ncbi:WW domain-binding protein 4 [Phymastichus coffea]|uniref:WW domain-binding protein 4 n=1 Tax=Phymastichus coffea TaxID=108790 RepID=UPI00273B6479|nr:WW domain-binding protein 4 [Phymastichus coffea]